MLSLNHYSVLILTNTSVTIKLLNPQIEGVAVGVVAVITKVSIAVSRVSVEPRRSLFCDSNPMICPFAIISSSTDHHYSSITTFPVTPESQVTTTLKIAAAVHLTEAHCR